MPPDSHVPSPSEDLDKILVSEDAINKRLVELGQEITQAYQGREVAVIAIINGAVIFVADLIRQINLPVQLDCIRVSSYRDETRPVQEPEVIDRIRLDLKGVDVILIDDILDTGNTLAKITKEIEAMQPASLKTCVLLDKQTPRKVDFNADYVGFEIPDEFVVGYGLDFAERYRHLPCIGVLKPELQNPPQWA
ncbi:hypoxanthine phosphoribosyltransferase [Coraliomargarita akajimensis]|uniref:Hypoxanthine phosphoribosyltransferase n=1 Tax=Coraliomargarita akajimensis (strain DSM 45221 / IAM 15411 / JCM 23193 / KCTC 12865 / 04OKA010-24) TaxID=583355 RepID=D5EJN3_CORAD|nr:hypoxanthine phosphoribosyltransferase [Coraliomargarita akajimensis]ADE54632.1 hypoxanthine phosphoribosyltransferase [Coraliomargarita akajimensis DSM 45221]